MNVELTCFANRPDGNGGRSGRIVIGDFSEKLHISTSYWEPLDYFEQWTRARERIKDRAKLAWFVVSVDNPIEREYDDARHLVLLPCGVRGDELLIQECHFPIHSIAPFDPWDDLSEMIGGLYLDSDGTSSVSTWRVPLEGLEIVLDVVI